MEFRTRTIGFARERVRSGWPMIRARFIPEGPHMPVELERRGGVAILTLNRPEALNALSFSVLREIEARVTEIERGVEQETCGRSSSPGRASARSAPARTSRS